jgi:prolipoprotein diacylglyceryltransferase
LRRHPVQLYEAITYLAIFLVMLWLYRTKRATANGVLTGTYLALVFSARFGLEFFKTPQAAYEAGNAITVGQYLSVPFVVVGVVLLLRARYAQIGGTKAGE